jgi:hypothetical protein
MVGPGYRQPKKKPHKEMYIGGEMELANPDVFSRQWHSKNKNKLLPYHHGEKDTLRLPTQGKSPKTRRYR